MPIRPLAGAASACARGGTRTHDNQFPFYIAVSATGGGERYAFFILVLYQLSYPCMAGGFFIAVCVALYAYEYGNLPETAISVKWLFATCAGHILISKAGNVDGCC